ncbi:hypothetical protein [Nocardia sp. NPDC056000]|uniref:DUF6630 family protein n=1 Tax=Nocardia sp. NPDC056000 TaxID=3345674 RepID=UPI0035E33CB4
MSSQEWDTFAMNLAGVLTRSLSCTVMNLSAGTRSLGITKDDDGVSLCLGEDLGASRQERLRQTGWARSDSDKLWWYRIRDTGFAACRDIACAAIDVLRLVLEFASPDSVRAEGWVDAPTDIPVPLGQLRASAPTPIDDDVAALLAIAEILLADYPWLVATVRYRLTDPDESHDLGLWRGLLSVLGEPFFGGLGVIAQCDWKQERNQVRDMLRRLPSHPEALSWDWYPDFLASTADWDSGDITEALLARVGTYCGPLGFALVSLETESDYYAVTFIPLDQMDRLTALTTIAGHRVRALPLSR